MTDIVTADGLTLEARWDSPAQPRAAVVFCHPHPQQRGTMNAPLMQAVTDRLTEHRFAVLRFNFRGVGRSEGGWGGGTPEIADVEAAVRAAESARPDLPQMLAGWSFGAVTALRWQVSRQDGRPYAGIAPPVDLSDGTRLPPPEDLPQARRLFVLGDRDQFVSVDQLTSYASVLGGAVEVLKGSDHFFYFRERRVADTMADHFEASL